MNPIKRFNKSVLAGSHIGRMNFVTRVVPSFSAQVTQDSSINFALQLEGFFRLLQSQPVNPCQSDTSTITFLRTILRYTGKMPNETSERNVPCLRPGQAIEFSHHGVAIPAVITGLNASTYSVQVPSGTFRLPFHKARPCPEVESRSPEQDAPGGHTEGDLHLSDPDIRIPSTIDFADLQLELDENGHIKFDRNILNEISITNQLSIESIVGPHLQGLPKLLLAWYTRHRLAGGDQNPACEYLMFGG